MLYKLCRNTVLLWWVMCNLKNKLKDTRWNPNSLKFKTWTVQHKLTINVFLTLHIKPVNYQWVYLSAEMCFFIWQEDWSRSYSVPFLIVKGVDRKCGLDNLWIRNTVHDEILYVRTWTLRTEHCPQWQC